MSTSTESPCSRCGVTYGFHICLDLPHDIMRRTVAPKKTERRYAPGVSERWVQYRIENEPRDERIVELYKAGGMNYTEIGVETATSKGTVIRVLQEAAEHDPEIIMRGALREMAD